MKTSVFIPIGLWTIYIIIKIGMPSTGNLSFDALIAGGTVLSAIITSIIVAVDYLKSLKQPKIKSPA